MSEKTKKPVKQYKTDTVTALKDKLTRAKAFFITDYRGLTHPQLETLRKALKKVKAEFVVAKNTLMRIAMKNNAAMENATMQQFEKELNNPTATLFAFEDPITVIKELAAFIKNTQLPKIKIGLVDGQLTSAADFSKLAILPSKEQLIATFVVRLKSPIYGLHYALSWNMRKLVTVLDNVKNKK